jgi:hypothetical protein
MESLRPCDEMVVARLDRLGPSEAKRLYERVLKASRWRLSRTSWRTSAVLSRKVTIWNPVVQVGSALEPPRQS